MAAMRLGADRHTLQRHLKKIASLRASRRLGRDGAIWNDVRNCVQLHLDDEALFDRDVGPSGSSAWAFSRTRTTINPRSSW